MNRRTRLAGTLVLCLLPLAAHAGANAESTRIAAVAARSSIAIDGRLDEQAWTAPPFSAFVQRDPIEGAAPTEQTDVRVVFDEQNLYVGIRLHDRRAGSIGRRLSRRDESPDADTVQVYLDRKSTRLN